MLASTPTSDYISLRSRARDHSMSPSCRGTATPPRRKAERTSSSMPSYDSPMLTPSPLRNRPQRPLFVNQSSSGDVNDIDDLFLPSPFRSPAPRRYRGKPQPIAMDDDDGGIFLTTASAPSSSSLSFPASDSQPLRTPIKQVHRIPSRSALSIKPMNAPSSDATLHPVGTGTKRKSTPHSSSFATPLRRRTSFTPLPLTHGKSTGTSPGLDRLAPLPAPRFTGRTPQTKAETESYLRGHTESMTRLRIGDLDDSGDEFGGVDDDSGCEVDEEERVGRKPDSLSKKLGLQLLMASKGKGKEEVVEDISPGGHINKRRARSRPVSLELLESVNNTPSPSKQQQKEPTVAFPSVRQRRISTASSEAGSPLPRRRVSGATLNPHIQQPYPSARAPMHRMASNGSATLFFGPPISPSRLRANVTARSRTNTTSSSAGPPSLPRFGRPSTANRHSYAGTGLSPWGPSRSTTPSPCSSPSLRYGMSDQSHMEDEDEDMFFGSGSGNGPQDSSFVFSITEGTPSPRSKAQGSAIPKKYKPRDSGIALSDDEDEDDSLGGSSHSSFLGVMPGASTSVGSMNSDAELVTPSFPGPNSGWPTARVANGSGDEGENSRYGGEGGIDVDAFILKTLEAGAKGPGDGMKKVPGTPVKKVKTSLQARVGVDRPWQSAVAAKVSGFGFGFDTGKAKAKKPPRQSLPAAFPALGGARRVASAGNGSDTDEDEEFNSPSARKDGRYEGLGLGRPGVSGTKQWLMRRSSSGAFSSGSDVSAAGTPTRLKGKEWQLPPPRISTQFSPTNLLRLSSGGERSASGSSTSSVATLNSPTVARHLPIYNSHRQTTPLSKQHDASSTPIPPSPVGRFQRDFLEVGEVGSGEFGKVMKVQYKDGDENEVFAVKRSKRFEGVRHRLRLREEVEILQHLSRAARGTHANVLAYIDSWEQDETLYIQTELCENGNFARFLWEYGRVMPRLDEARVWKIMVDLSTGLKFIHDSGVIHLDLKPANIFITIDGRFKIGDFGMASLWPRPKHDGVGFEREGDKNYLAPEVLQGRYGKAADIFSLGMTMLETAANIVVPDQGEAWHRLRQEDFSQIDLEGSPELFDLIQSMMRADPTLRVDVATLAAHPVISRARAVMEHTYSIAKAAGVSVFAASPLGTVRDGFLRDILQRPDGDRYAMDLSP